MVPFNESVKDNGTPYTVFTPFKNKFLRILSPVHYAESKVNLSKLNRKNELQLNNNFDFESEYKKFDKSGFLKGGRSNAVVLLNYFFKSKIKNYAVDRDFPAIEGTSLLSAHLHFGTISIRECFRAYKEAAKDTKGTDEIYKWREELIWREFYYSITYHFPHVINSAFKKDYDKVKWNYDKRMFKLWCEGKTGFPIVDAGMRQLNKEGWMHNRVRMIVAMFLTKDLLIDWRWGEKYFAEKLIDLDFSSNNGGWQWSASTGCDAQPYFRIFNPYLQSKKYDSDGIYIKRYVPELTNVKTKYIHNPSEMPAAEQSACGVIIGNDYPAPIVNHSEVSKIAIETFKNIKNKP
ncbi:MAG: deoxyribodipyrimidine photo-lyase [Ignavibacteriae bacterium]|nr:deoxyribodipyrimidine photo-lyase [Ignavibacteriota bacterium]